MATLQAAERNFINNYYLRRVCQDGFQVISHHTGGVYGEFHTYEGGGVSVYHVPRKNDSQGRTFVGAFKTLAHGMRAFLEAEGAAMEEQLHGKAVPAN